MPRITYTQALSPRYPVIGCIVFYHPRRTSEFTPTTLPAIIHHIGDAALGLVDLTVFTDKGPVVKRDVKLAPGLVEESWTFDQNG